MNELMSKWYRLVKLSPTWGVIEKFAHLENEDYNILLLLSNQKAYFQAFNC